MSPAKKHLFRRELITETARWDEYGLIVSGEVKPGLFDYAENPLIEAALKSKDKERPVVSSLLSKADRYILASK